jgi:hypothetical protein
MHSDVLVRLERIKELWLELEGTNRTSASPPPCIHILAFCIPAFCIDGDFLSIFPGAGTGF